MDRPNFATATVVESLEGRTRRHGKLRHALTLYAGFRWWGFGDAERRFGNCFLVGSRSGAQTGKMLGEFVAVRPSFRRTEAAPQSCLEAMPV
jgi:hypothetical protein